MVLINYTIWAVCIIFAVLINISCLGPVNQFSETRIVGGYECNRNNRNTKFMIALTGYWGNNFCGGSLLSPKWVLSAAHCFQKNVYIYASDALTRDKYVLEDGSLSWWCPVHYIRAVYNHPNYTRFPPNNDVALLRLDTPMYANKSIQYVKLPSTSIDGDVSNICNIGTILGWGRTNIDVAKCSAKLMCVDLRIMSTADCRIYYRMKDTYICTEPSFIKDSCYGDSGGPLTCDEIQYGITSWGWECAKGFPAFYTRVDQFLDFINYTMKNNGLQICRLNFIIYMIGLLLCHYNLPY